jgi:ribonuclease HII
MDNTFDKMYYHEGELIAGIDESGVSDIAGPLVAACVILPKIDVHKDDLRIFEIDDSKKIPEKYRKKHAEVIWQTAIAIGIGEVQPSEIDYLGSIGATKLAMFRSIVACSTVAKGKTIKPDLILVDKIANFAVPVRIKQKLIDQGDTKSLCIAAASVVAKVYRDEIMIKLHEKFPHYDWISNKGYPCENHFKGIDSHGVQIGLHRIKRWPFIKNPSLTEDHMHWERRRGLWKKVTSKKMQQEVGAKLWSSKPVF